MRAGRRAKGLIGFMLEVIRVGLQYLRYYAKFYSLPIHHLQTAHSHHHHQSADTAHNHPLPRLSSPIPIFPAPLPISPSAPAPPS